MHGRFSIERDLTDEGFVRLLLHGELDLAHTDDLHTVLLELEQDDPPTLVVDTTELAFIDSMGLGVLVEARNRFGPGGFRLVPGDATLRVLEASGTKHFLLDT